MKRYGSVIGVNEEKMEEYKRLHAAVWPEVKRMITECNFTNYSIYLCRLPDGNHYLFSYYEYVGEDFEADFEKMAADKKTREWWDLCASCQVPLDDSDESKEWIPMEEVFHQD